MPTYDQSPGLLDLRFVQGDEVARELTWEQNDEPMDMTGYTFVAQILPADGDPIPLTVVATDLEGGVITLTLSEAVSATIPVATHRWRLRWTAPGSVLRTALSGNCTVLA